jgi:hypothetical protein
MNRRRWLSGLVLALALSTAAPSAASANYYTLSFTPSSVPSGSRATISAEIRRTTSGTQIGSANITAPPGFTLVSAAIAGPATATVSANTAQLRNLSIPVNQSRTATLVVDTPCAPTTGTWSVIAKSNGSYSGSPLSNHGSGVPTTTTTGTCALSFTTQPRDVQVGSTITGDPANPSGPPIRVGILDGAGNTTNAARPVTIAIGSGPAGATLTGTTTVTSSGGVATFSDLKVDKPGTYTLTASSPGTTPATSSTSSAFQAAQGLALCQNNVFCTAFASITGTVPGSNPPVSYTNTVRVDAAANPDGTVGDDGGPLSVSYNLGPNFTCSGHLPVSPDREVILGPNREKLVTSKTAKALLDAAGIAASQVRTCLLAPYQFNLGLPLIGGVAQNVGDVDGDGSTDYRGLLPGCLDIITVLGIHLLIGPPCQVSATADAQGNAIVVYRLPADPRDPYIRH